MANDELELYRRWLACGLEQEKCQEQSYVQESFAETIQQSPAYQEDAEVNGEPQPIVATRKDTNKCDVTVIPGDRLYIGDLVKVFNEYWICVEMYVDEFGMYYGELWMCNHIFCYQDFELNIIHKYAILDDGSYSNGNDKAIKVTDNSFNCYVSLDDESRALYIDKRLGISVIYDKNGKEILEAGKIKWIDIKSRNFGEGSHLMVFGINEDPYKPDSDNIAELICDYQEKPVEDEDPEEPIAPPEDPVVPPDESGDGDDNGEENEGDGDKEEPSKPELIIKGTLSIDGKKTIKAGSGRTYSVTAIEEESSNTIEAPEDVEWSLEFDGSGVSITPNGATCKVSVKESDSLIGSIFTLKCSSPSGEYKEAKINVEVT